jgi:hypothetical protein
VRTDERVIANPYRMVLITGSRRPEHGVLGDDDTLAHMHGQALSVTTAPAITRACAPITTAPMTTAVGAT